MAKDTKDRILDAALEIFARDGYAGTNIKDIAEEVGIVKSALYRHFDSKQAIWDGVLDRVAAHYEANFGSAEHLPTIPQNRGELLAMTMGMLNFTVHDSRVILTRRLLQTEQFRDEKARECANNYFLFGTEAMFTKIFAAMMEQGTMKAGDPSVLAFSYTAPITVLIHFCDRNPGKEPEAMNRLQKFVEQFMDTYCTK